MPYDVKQHFGDIIDDGKHGPYKGHYACFACRKVWKPHIHPPEAHYWANHRNVETCPECGGETVSLGPSFKAPPRRDKRAWKAIEEYLRIRWGYIPAEAREILEKTQDR